LANKIVVVVVILLYRMSCWLHAYCISERLLQSGES